MIQNRDDHWKLLLLFRWKPFRTGHRWRNQKLSNKKQEVQVNIGSLWVIQLSSNQFELNFCSVTLWSSPYTFATWSGKFFLEIKFLPILSRAVGNSCLTVCCRTSMFLFAHKLPWSHKTDLFFINVLENFWSIWQRQSNCRTGEW